MSGTRGGNTELLSVSIVTGPSAAAVLAKRGPAAGTVVEQPAGSTPEQVIQRVKELAAQPGVRALLIECEPDRPPMAYASLFSGDDDEHSLAHVARLRATIFAIEPATFLDSILDRGANSLPACFTTEQMEFVDQIVFADGSPEFDLAQSIALALNPRARLFRLADVNEGWWQNSSAGPFDFNAALAGAGWRQLLEGEQELPATGNRVTALGYSAWRPFHPERFSNFIREKSQSVFRAKGFFWLASRMDEVGGLNLAGADLHCSSAGSWWATRDPHTRDAEMPAHARQQWREPFGDRRQALGIMALDVDRETLKSALDACLLTDAELSEGPESWRDLPDPFPSWSQHQHHHHDHSHQHGEACDHDHHHHHDSDEHHCCQH